MKLWSKGLGRTELKMDFRTYQVTQAPDSKDVYISGNITDPVNWEFRITMTPEDVAGLIKIALSFSMIKLIIKNAYRYISYLFNKKKYAPEADIVQKVSDAHKQMMFRADPGDKSRPRPKLQRR